VGQRSAVKGKEKIEDRQCRGDELRGGLTGWRKQTGIILTGRSGPKKLVQVDKRGLPIGWRPVTCTGIVKLTAKKTNWRGKTGEKGNNGVGLLGVTTAPQRTKKKDNKNKEWGGEKKTSDVSDK